MPLPRTLEPEVMDTEREASDYDAMDHPEVNERFCRDLLTVRVPMGRVLDVGTGTARIPIELCRLARDALVDAIDMSTAMLAIPTGAVRRTSDRHWTLGPVRKPDGF